MSAAKKKTAPKKKTKKPVEIMATGLAMMKDGDDFVLTVLEANGEFTHISMSRVGAETFSDGLAAQLNRPLEQGPTEWACSAADAWVAFAYPENGKRPKEMIASLPPKLSVSLDFLANSTKDNPLRKVFRK